jgi:hypothetical protein
MVEGNLIWQSNLPFINQTIAEVATDKKKIPQPSEKVIVEYKQSYAVG